ncbi:FtsX-like permease family protein [Thalassoglobus sp. JC818]|uniref:ABC transporter permease n=1 Tax=Thalassoglobus sp. JC818 TaxID=3232136 RepID=UPI003458A23B
MWFRDFLIDSLRYYWRNHLAVLLGVAAATAVIAGALVVGDSVRDSLRQMSLDRLGKIDHAVTGFRFFREELANRLSDADQQVQQSAPAILMQGTLERTSDDDVTTRASHIELIGTDERLWSMLDTNGLASPENGEVVLSQRVADQLQVQVGDQISVLIEIPASIPRDSLLGDREETITELVVDVSAIADESNGVARFGLNPSQQIPANAFVNLSDLQSQIGLAEVRRSLRNPVAKPARVNALFVSTGDSPAIETIGPDVAKEITTALSEELTLEDLALRLVPNEEQGYLSLESDQMILDDQVAEAAEAAANSLNLRTSSVLVYLLNRIWNPDDPDKYSMYSVIAGVDPETSAPFGPFDFVGEHAALSDGSVYLNDWLATDLDLRTGQKVAVKFYEVGDRGELPEQEEIFDVAGVVALQGVADDMGFTPNVPGVTDADSYGDWRAPFPLKRNLITDRDHLYWDNKETERESDYRTTPKMFTSLKTAQKLWKSRYGELTSFRIAPGEGQSLAELSDEFEQRLLSELKPSDTGIVAQPIKAAGLMAAQGTTDFTGLFIGFSFFLIFSAMLLIGLLFRLGIEDRISELGLLNAIGMTTGRVRRIYLYEGLIVALLGGLIGMVLAVGYAAIMIHGLKTWWFGAVGTPFLNVYVHVGSLLIGLFIAIIVAALAIFRSLWQTRSQSTRQLLNAQTEPSTVHQQRNRKRTERTAVALLVLSSLILLLTLVGAIPDSEAFSGFSWRIVAFFLVGFGMLIGGLFAFSALLQNSNRILDSESSKWGTLQLGLRNAARNRSRSVLSASLIASATFVIVAVAAGRQDPANAEPKTDSGNGGFSLVAETNIPVLYDLNTVEGRSKLGIEVLDEELMATLDQASVMPFRVRHGENASCLNLYQTQLPTVLAIPEVVLNDFIERERFLFADTSGDQPWKLLEGKTASGAVPVFGDMNTLLYSLHKGIGQVVNVPSDEDPKHSLEIVGMFANSVFQGVLVMSEENFREVFPEEVGFEYFLIETPLEAAGTVSDAFESSLGDYGFDAERVEDRLADFLAVQNTYLSTFQTLGGLGLLLGTIGLATVMLRNVIERRSELALMRAIGFRSGQLASVVALENAILLVCGLVLGTISALLAMAPHLSSSVASVPWSQLLGMLCAVLVVGMVSVIWAVRAAVSTPILSTLRSE